jgi:hypothetical protein
MASAVLVLLVATPAILKSDLERERKILVVVDAGATFLAFPLSENTYGYMLVPLSGRLTLGSMIHGGSADDGQNTDATHSLCNVGCTLLMIRVFFQILAKRNNLANLIVFLSIL